MNDLVNCGNQVFATHVIGGAYWSVTLVSHVLRPANNVHIPGQSAMFTRVYHRWHPPFTNFASPVMGKDYPNIKSWWLCLRFEQVTWKKQWTRHGPNYKCGERAALFTSGVNVQALTTGYLNSLACFQNEAPKWLSFPSTTIIHQ